MRPNICTALLLLLAAMASGRPLPAQTVAAAMDDGPRFFLAVAGNSSPVRTDPSRVSVLRARISVRLVNVTLEAALDAISAESGMRLAYSRALVPLDRRVSLSADNISVAAALTDALLGTGIDVLISRTGQLALVRRLPDPVQQEPGAIIGRVTDVGTNTPVVSAQVSVDGAGRSLTDEEGRYRIANVEPGRRSVSVTSIGYRRSSRDVDVTDGATVTVDFALEVLASQLDAIVVTATGEQRVRELGHVVGRINADSLVKEAPISTISELLTGRVAGVQVFQDQGTVGGSVRLKVRGPNSLALASEPIVIVDGVRYTTDQIPVSAGPGMSGLVTLAERTSPLNDLNPNDIESIEVAKGPSAATLYGTDAANGVIVITTKRGRGGPTRWNAYGRAARTSTPAFRYPDAHRGYGTTSFGTVADYCSLAFVERGLCVRQDSVVVVPNPLNDPALTFFGSQPMWETGLSVSGGGGDVGYYFSGSYQDATGPVRMPRAAVEQLEADRGERIPDEWARPNTRTNLNLRANVSAQLGMADLAVQAGYVRDATQSFLSSNPLSSIFGLVSGTSESPSGGALPEEVFASQSTERTDRFVGSATAHLRPVSWLIARAAFGLDVGARNRYSLLQRGAAPTFTFGAFSTGAVTDERARQVTTTGDLMASATARRGRLSFRTSVGAQYVRRLTDVLASSGRDLPPGGTSVVVAANRSASQNYSETVTLGGYVEEMVGLNDRLFLTGALRVDGASTFGQGYDAAAYPKAGVSWLASEEPFFPGVPGLDELRLRYAVGASGLQPKPEWARPGYAATSAFGWINDQPQYVLELTGLGSPDLRPERVREHEFGFDAGGLGGRAQLGLTWFRRRTVDQIVLVPVAPGFGSVFTNLGLTKQWGFEAELTAHVVDTRAFTWDVKATHSVHRTKLLDIGDAAGVGDPGGPALGSGSTVGFVEGYSLNARFLPEVTFEDVNGNGIIGADEVQVSPPDERVYAGENEPPISQALTTVLGFFDRRVRVSALLERRADFVRENKLKTLMCLNTRCRALLDATTPLAEQAEAMAVRSNFVFVEPGDYTRLRELTLAVDLPTALVRRVGGRSGAVSLSGRNLALWTGFSGADAESVVPRAGVSSVGGIPQGRTWTVRFDVGF